MLRKILIGIAVVVALLVVVVVTRPAAFHIERSTTIAAPPEIPFALVNDFHAFGSWSPWEKLDPNMQRTFEGAASGVGAQYEWRGNKDVGAGRMTIEKSDKPSRIVTKLQFLEPFEATNQATYTFVPTAEGTKVTWAMDGNNNFVSKAFSLVMDMDEVVGADFERGLAAMKQVAETTAKNSNP